MKPFSKMNSQNTALLMIDVINSCADGAFEETALSCSRKDKSANTLSGFRLAAIAYASSKACN